MKIVLNSAQPPYFNNSISFQSGELNHKFEKYLKEAITDGEDAQAFLRCIHRDTITFSPVKNSDKFKKLLMKQQYLRQDII
ncbi:MAG: hypothetical protein PHC34_12825 [Candidatus Gastranaerophilales bacterium]|nr:hypothetical protein [Candidatus Gastranaerophilales bacterium]